MRRRDFLTSAGVAASLLAVGTGRAEATTPKVGLKLGKAPDTSAHVGLSASPYFNWRTTTPEDFGHHHTIPDTGWGMLGNDLWGNCVFAGAAHEHQLLSRLAKKPVNFTYTNVMAAYSDVTGFNPDVSFDGYNPTDRGTRMNEALAYRRNHGIFDEVGNIHRIEAYAKLEAGNVDELAKAAYLFNTVGMGFIVPLYAMTQFQSGQPWHIPNDSRSEGDWLVGGHYVPIIGRQDGYFITISWGQVQLMEPEFYERWSDEVYALFDYDFLHEGRSPEGFDREALLNDLEKLDSE